LTIRIWKTRAKEATQFTLRDHFSANDFVITDRDHFVRHDPLLRVAKAVLGISGKSVQVNQCPDRGNEWSATVTVSYKFTDGSTFSAAADCRKSSAKGGFDIYTTAMAETRASSRALRFALGVDVCSAEELKDLNGVDIVSEDSPIEDGQMAVLKNKYMLQHGVTLEEIQEMADVVVLEELTKNQAMELFKKLNSKINRKARK